VTRCGRPGRYAKERGGARTIDDVLAIARQVGDAALSLIIAPDEASRSPPVNGAWQIPIGIDGVAVIEPHRDGRTQLVVSTVLERAMANERALRATADLLETSAIRKIESAAL
jgi:hypothetical protein